MHYLNQIFILIFNLKPTYKILSVLAITIVIGIFFSTLLYFIQGLILDGIKEAKPFHFLKIASRCLTISLFVVLILYCYKYEKRSIFSYGLNKNPFNTQLLVGGFLFGVLSMVVLITINLYFNHSIFSIAYLPKRFFGDLFFQLFIVFIIGFFEEWFFRGFVLQTLMEEYSVGKSVVVSSLFFAATHFIRPVSNWYLLIPEFFGLFLIGTILANAIVHTRSLYFSIGIHAGWVYIVKLDKYFINHFDLTLQKVFGGEKLLSRITSWILILLILYFLKQIIQVFSLRKLK